MENTKRAQKEKSRIRPSGETYVESKDLLSGLERVREAARRDSQIQFTSLFHHITVDLLRESYQKLISLRLIKPESRTRRGRCDMVVLELTLLDPDNRRCVLFQGEAEISPLASYGSHCGRETWHKCEPVPNIKGGSADI